MKSIFGKVDNLSGFIHPKFNQEFKFMNISESIDLAKKILKEFIKTNIKNIVVIESGTSPLIKLMKLLPEYKSADINIIQIKIPRDLNFYLYGWFKEYLDEEEFLSRECELKKLCDEFSLEELIGNEKFNIYDSVNATNNYHLSTKGFQECLKGTKLSLVFNQEFLVFDEYINAGTIIRNLNGMVKLFTDNINYKLSSFCMFLDNPQSIDRIAFTLFDNSTELECYQNGAYPFENRIDLIGYYFFINEDNFMKVNLDTLKQDIQNKINNCDCKNFLNYLVTLVTTHDLVNKLKSVIEIRDVRNYVDETDIVRFILKDIEEVLFGKSIYSDLYDQVYELYAPAWSPMPVVNHLDYWKSFSIIQDDIRSLYEEIKEEYQEVRFDVMNYTLEMLLRNKEEYERELEEEINR